MKNKQKTVYITSRGGTHPMHKAFADSIDCDFQLVDHHLPWHGVKSSIWKRYLSWLVCPFLFPKKNQYSLFINSGPQFPQVFMKKWGLLKKDQKISVLLANETLFFLSSKYYSKKTELATKWALEQYDIYICISDYMTELLKEVIDTKNKPIITLFNGVNENRMKKLSLLQPSLNTYNITFIANVYSGWRRNYKGLDLLLDSFQEARKTIPGLMLTCIGYIESEILSDLRKNKNKIDNVSFTGQVEEIEEYFRDSSLCIQPSVGESWGISVLEAMLAGLPTIVTNQIGVKEVVEKIDKSFVVEANVSIISDRIIKYFESSIPQRKIVSDIGKSISSTYTIKNATNHFKSSLQSIIK